MKEIMVTLEEWQQMFDSMAKSLNPTISYTVKEHNKLVTSIIDRHLIKQVYDSVLKGDKNVG